MKKSIIRISSMLLIVAILLSISITVFANDTKNKMNRFNVVFVTDTSGSMSNTDPDNYRFESIELFVRLLANGGNNVGSIVFSNGVVSKHDMINVNGKAEKDSISSQIRKEAPNGWTDIGSGLMTAVDMLKSKGDPSLPSIIILLTDGNTEMRKKTPSCRISRMGFVHAGKNDEGTSRASRKKREGGDRA